MAPQQQDKVDEVRFIAFLQATLIKDKVHCLDLSDPGCSVHLAHFICNVLPDLKNLRMYRLPVVGWPDPATRRKVQRQFENTVTRNMHNVSSSCEVCAQFPALAFGKYIFDCRSLV